MDTGPEPAAPPMNLYCGPAAAAVAVPGVAASAAPPVKKERRIVSWSPEEDELLREQIALHGTENWTSIAARFKDKTSRQCRRRWYTYLNSEAKKGGWSVEEDMLLCEVQKIFGNRWTEIAKVVSGRTDNAVKNRFSTLCKKRVKLEASTKENIRPPDNPSNKRVLVQSSCNIPMTREMSAANKQTRYLFSESDENAECNKHKGLQGVNKSKDNCARRPLSVLFQNLNRLGKPESNIIKSSHDASGGNQVTFLKKGDPKLTSLLQQAELLSSLSEKVNADNTERSLEDAWKELQDFLIQTEESGPLPEDLSGMNLLDQLKEILEDLKPTNTGGEQPLRQLDSCMDAQGSSKYNSEKNHDDESRNDPQTKNSMRSQDEVIEIDEAPSAPVNACSEVFLSTGKAEDDVNSFSTANQELASPLQTILPFHSFEDEIPSPAFTSSERNFLLSVLNQSSPVNNSNSCKQPSCKRVLMNTLGPS